MGSLLIIIKWVGVSAFRSIVFSTKRYFTKSTIQKVYQIICYQNVINLDAYSQNEFTNLKKNESGFPSLVHLNILPNPVNRIHDEQNVVSFITAVKTPFISIKPRFFLFHMYLWKKECLLCHWITLDLNDIELDIGIENE